MTPVVLTYSAPFASLAQGEARRTGLCNFRRLAPDVLLADWPGTFQRLSQRWRHRPPIYVRHIHPVQPNPPQLAQTLEKPAPLFVQPFQPNLPTLYRFQDCAGVVWPAQQLTPWPWGVPHFTPDPELVNRAIATFNLRLHGRALDLGAAPGGWSRVLNRAGLSVTAVDPRDMQWKHPNLIHHQQTAQEHLAQSCQSYDLIVNDMWMHAEESAEIMLRAAPRLRSGSLAVITLKLGNVAEELESRRGPLRRALNLLRSAYRIPRLKQLFYNRFEVTVWLQRL
ncbi:MAG: methyltransferase domain-containing protein [Candidatus Eremiobacteraeota bacterium]|nr:methyltransferase domain-containing protein [Candidatus Eremiobacteraeota bacterium]MCW5872216.1 methyltransferase domain-containing protein [Candidatus Eremiobacteraeota bacterium]